MRQQQRAGQGGAGHPGPDQGAADEQPWAAQCGSEAARGTPGPPWAAQDGPGPPTAARTFSRASHEQCAEGPKGTGLLRGSTDQDRRRRGAARVVPERPGAAWSRPQQARKPCSGEGDAERLGALGRFRVSTASSANPRRRERRQPFQKQSLSGFANPSAQTADVRKSHRSAAAVCGWQVVRPGRACCPQRGTFFAGSLPRGSTHSRNIPPPMLQKRGLEKKGAETAVGSAARCGQARGALLGLDIQPAGRPGGRMQGTDRRRPT